ncbi:MAG: hypothetical protein RIB59_08265, partial [Rhodospirillales bacterium]
ANRTITNRVVIVHDLEQATAALRAADACNCRVTLRSAPNAASYLSAGVFNAMIEAAAQAVPEARFDAVFDCGAEPGLALNALRHGVKAVRVDVGDDVLRKVADIAGQLGAAAEPYDDAPVLDLAAEKNEKDPQAACRDWLNAA